MQSYIGLKFEKTGGDPLNYYIINWGVGRIRYLNVFFLREVAHFSKKMKQGLSIRSAKC